MAENPALFVTPALSNASFIFDKRQEMTVEFLWMQSLGRQCVTQWAGDWNEQTLQDGLVSPLPWALFSLHDPGGPVQHGSHRLQWPWSLRLSSTKVTFGKHRCVAIQYYNCLLVSASVFFFIL